MHRHAMGHLCLKIKLLQIICYKYNCLQVSFYWISLKIADLGS